LRFDPQIADEVANAHAGLILMHSRGTPKTMQRLPPIDNVMKEVIDGLRESILLARQHAVLSPSIAIDPGIGFGKTAKQNLGLIANLEQLSREFSDFPVVIGTSRKSFIGKLLNGAPADQRLYGTIASTVVATMNGANIVRVHDVKAAVDTLRIVDAIARAG
jgi:dihydropteroate synthase